MSILGTALTGLRTAQTLIDTTGNNIANANTPGYVRQRADVSTLGTVGYQLGAQVARIRRDVPTELQNQVRLDGAKSYASSAYADGATRVDQILGDTESGLNSVMNSFFSSAQALTQDPSSTPNRQTFLAQAGAMANRINQMGEQLSREEDYLSNSMRVGADRLNQLADELVSLNRRIADQSNLQTPPLQLMDQRDQVLFEMSDLAGVDVFPLDANQVAVYLSGGSVLVSGQSKMDVAAEASQSDPTRLQLVLQSNGSTVGFVPNGRLEGTLGGLNQLLDDVVLPARNELGLIAMSIADAVNTTLGQGLDMNGDFGAPLFKDLNSAGFLPGRAIPNLTNGANGQITVTIDDTQAMTGKDYNLAVAAGGAFTVLDRFGAPVTSGTLNAGADTSVSFHGITLTLGPSGDYVAGDKFGIQPTRRAAEALSVALQDPSALGLAAPVIGTDSLANGGSGAVSYGATLAVGTGTNFTTSPAAMTPELNVEFGAGNTYVVKNAGTGATLWSSTYTPGQTLDLFSSTPGDISYTGFSATLNGLPEVGDTFNFGFNAGGTGDNRNAQALAGLQTAGWLNGGEKRFSDAYGGLVGSVGSKASLGQITAAADQSIYSASETRLGDISGVNLDEEAANLVRYQQYYQASAQVISIANDLFQTLLGSLR
ncbi:flagellar hook-associated protein FlgK [Litorivicinus lipolyticus]|uniref:Flagellar hook-associated protein 1 n=1 Tax=Litorivicinus lipolyticus TaxID=418701 RepID=A0A5Q2Q810_9GAMM|nr:flagellar hook-associated protein FlgK [Litorivicinus lipolyticus]QGG80218.1 flagellar hook-associated protein FlgK [Litorivicinus lipolyticus]